MTLKKIILKQKGFTLIEIITVIVVLSILGAFTFTFIDHAMKTYAMGSRQRMIYQEASYIMERITKEVMDAQSVSIDSGTGGLRVVKPSHTTNNMVTDSSTNVLFYKNVNREMLRNSTSVSNMVIGKNVEVFSPSLSSCSSGTSNCTVTINLQLTDSSIPIDDASARSVILTTTISPKNIAPSTNPYSGRCFNGDYEDVIQ